MAATILDCPTIQRGSPKRAHGIISSHKYNYHYMIIKYARRTQSGSKDQKKIDSSSACYGTDG